MDEKTYATGEPKKGTHNWRWFMALAVVAVVAITVWFLLHDGVFVVISYGIVIVIIAALVMYFQRNGQQPTENHFPVEKAGNKDDSSDLL